MCEVLGQNASGKTSVSDLFYWITTNKDSGGNEKFEVRPLDIDGNKVHYVDIIGEALFLIDDDLGERTIQLRKTQKEKWVKKRGDEEQEYSGNENRYEIDGYPTNESGFYATVAQVMASATDFFLLTNPNNFNATDWKVRRKILLGLLNIPDDVTIARNMGGYDEILDELSKARSTDDILKKYKSEKKELQKRQNELPTRIDEASLRKVYIDASELSKRREALTAESAQIAEDIAKAEEANNQRKHQIESLAGEVRAKRTKLAELLDSYKADYRAEKKELETAEQNKREVLRMVTSQIKQEEAFQNHARGEVKYFSDQVKRLQNEYIVEKKSVFTGSEICPTCGQPLPKEQIETAKANWAKQQENRLNDIIARGKDAAAKRDAAQEAVDERGKSIAELLEKKNTIDAELAKIADDLKNVVEPDSLETAADYQSIVALIDKQEQELKEMTLTRDIDTSALVQRKSEIQRELVEIGISEAQIAQNQEIDERIETLKEELREVSQKVLNCEKVIYLVEKFVSAKMDYTSDSLNSLFNGVKFKLFVTLINGGIQECCECTVDGVPYSDLNHGHRILAGVEIIRALQKSKNVSLPIFIDDAESLSSENVPKVDGQLILLKVTDDPELRIEVIKE